MLIGHQKQWQFLKKSAQLGRLSHAYLFSGQEKLGKKKVALEWISLLFGQPFSKLLSGTHPDFILISPLQKEIQISQIKDLNWRLSLRPYFCPLKAAIIDQAHSMNQEAQNCFLKTLEEPQGKSLLILITEYPEFLLPTIRSRLQIIKFYPVSKKEIESYLRGQGINEKKIQLISQIFQGKPGVAIDFLNQPQKLKEREILLKEIINLTKADLTSRFQYAKKISQLPNLKEILNLWLSYFREKLISSLDSQEKSEKIGKLVKILNKIQEIFFLISTTNVNSRLAIETLMLEF
jgi:DNA polymerase-3 subunit delta'